MELNDSRSEPPKKVEMGVPKMLAHRIPARHLESAKHERS
jgi:hypothetical protein